MTRNGLFGECAYGLVAFERGNDIAYTYSLPYGVLNTSGALTPAQLSAGAPARGHDTETVEVAVQIRHLGVLCLGAHRHLMPTLSERRNLQILTTHRPTPAPVYVLQVVTADKRRILTWLVGGEMGDEPTIAQCGGITVEHEHATGMAGYRKQLPGAARDIDITGERALDQNPLTLARRARDSDRRLSVLTTPRGQPALGWQWGRDGSGHKQLLAVEERPSGSGLLLRDVDRLVGTCREAVKQRKTSLGARCEMPEAPLRGSRKVLSQHSPVTKVGRKSLTADAHRTEVLPPRADVHRPRRDGKLRAAQKRRTTELYESHMGRELQSSRT